MAVLRAVVVLLSLIAVSIFYTDILEDELINQDTAGKKNIVFQQYFMIFHFQKLFFRKNDMKRLKVRLT